MYERRYGEKYEGWQDAAVVAKKVRADIKAAVAAGTLPADLTYRVRTSKYAGGQSIRVIVEGMSDAEQYETWTDWNGRQERRWSPAAQALRGTLQRLLDAYNHDGSEAMVDYYDVMYYSFVEIEDDWGRRSRERVKAIKAARKQAKSVA